MPTCIHHAVGEGCSQDVLRTIVNHGADVNVTNKNNITTLMTACKKGMKDAIKVLLNTGADPNAADADGNTCLHYTARNDCCTEILQTIISHGADVNATDKKKVTALMLACAKGNEDAINVLLDAGTYPNIADANGDTCLHYTARKEFCTEILQSIITHGADVNATNKKNVTALMMACVKGNKDAINILLNTGADPNIADAFCDSCLHYAARNNCCTEVFEAIIGHGGDVDGTHNLTPLMLACEKGIADATNALINAGADPYITDCMGATCIHHAVLNRSSKYALEAVVNHGVDVNVANKKNLTALMLACMKANEDAINTLLNTGADPNIASYGNCSKGILQARIGHVVTAKNKNNVTALMIACQYQE